MRGYRQIFALLLITRPCCRLLSFSRPPLTDRTGFAAILDPSIAGRACVRRPVGVSTLRLIVWPLPKGRESGHHGKAGYAAPVPSRVAQFFKVSALGVQMRLAESTNLSPVVPLPGDFFSPARFPYLYECRKSWWYMCCASKGEDATLRCYVRNLSYFVSR